MTIERNIIQVPDMSAVELTALAKRDLNLTCLDRDYAEWDFYHDVNGDSIPGRGKQFEVMVWRPELEAGESISSQQVRNHFSQIGFIGNTAAFTEWRRQNPSLLGFHASILEDKDCWIDSPLEDKDYLVDDGMRLDFGSDLNVPLSYFNESYRKLTPSPFGCKWYNYCSFVAFREVS